MDYKARLSISYYREVAVINEKHHISLVQHIENHKFFIKKVLNVYNIDIYHQLQACPIQGIPQICELYEEDNHLTVIEEFIQGKTLDECLKTDETLSNETVYHYIIQLCDILSQLHHLTPSIIHRDIKPSNIMITPFGHVVLLDFNAAKFMDESKSSDTVLLGTKGYAAPEQYGFGSSSVQTDIYGLGVLLNILLTGQLPKDQLASEPFALIIQECTNLRPEDRYPSINELKKALLKLKLKRIEDSTVQITYENCLLPPGFRTKNLFHMLIAILGYAMIFYFGMTLNVEDATPIVLFINRLLFTLTLLLMVLFTFNYRNVHNVFPFCTNSNRFLRNTAIASYDFLIFFIMIILMIIIENILM